METARQHALDIENAAELVAYLRSCQRIGEAEQPTVSTHKGGVSNRTVLIELASDERWVIKQALPKLRVQVDWFSDPARAQREAHALRRLQQLAPQGAVPRFLFEDANHHLLAMEAVPEPHEVWKSVLLSGRVLDEHIDAFAGILGTMHIRAVAQRSALASEFGDRSHYESLRLEPFYRYTSNSVPDAARFLNELTADCRQQDYTLVHGDYSPKNILIHGERVVLVDHEVVHFGDGAFDSGFALAHLLSKARLLERHRQTFVSAAKRFWYKYNDSLTGDSSLVHHEERVVRHALGCLLARVAGRSPLEYLAAAAQRRQREVVLRLMNS